MNTWIVYIKFIRRMQCRTGIKHGQTKKAQVQEEADMFIFHLSFPLPASLFYTLIPQTTCAKPWHGVFFFYGQGIYLELRLRICWFYLNVEMDVSAS